MYKMKDAAQYIGVGIAKMYKLLDKGFISPEYTVGKHRMFAKKELDRYLSVKDKPKAPETFTIVCKTCGIVFEWPNNTKQYCNTCIEAKAKATAHEPTKPPSKAKEILHSLKLTSEDVQRLVQERLTK